MKIFNWFKSLFIAESEFDGNFLAKYRYEDNK